MRLPNSIFRIALPAVYLALLVTAYFLMRAHERDTAFGAVPLVILTMPWSLIGSFFDGTSSSPPDRTLLWLIIFSSALLNCALLFFSGYFWDRNRKSESDVAGRL